MRKAKTRGQALVEMALVLPLFIFIILGIFDFGRILHCCGTLNYQCVRAARASTRRINPLLTGSAMIPSAFPTLAETAIVFNQFRSPMMATSNYLDQNATTYTDYADQTVVVPVNFSYAGIGTGSDTVEIKASYNLDMITPFFGALVGGQNKPGAITVHAYASEAKE